MSFRVKARLVAVCALLGLSGCSSVAKGVVEGLLAKDEEALAPQLCKIRSRGFDGLEAMMQDNASSSVPAKTKLLMVHGIGEHNPGYSARLSEALTQKLGLSHVSEQAKVIDLRSPGGEGEPKAGLDIGQLHVSRFTNENQSRELLFYELTWSNVIDEERQLIAFDDTARYNSDRADVNTIIKSFFNSHVPDPMIYLGAGGDKILASVGQSLCWMMRDGWDDLALAQAGSCTDITLDKAANDNFVFVTHSLGSRIMVDSLHRLASFPTDQFDALPAAEKARLDEIYGTLKQREISIYMLANQLPLLQLGKSRPDVAGQKIAYCRAGGAHYEDRMFAKTNIVAFSDPNDILSYEIPPGYARKYVDSRLCAEVSNVSVRVAPVVDLFGLGDFSNPAEAHGDYEIDETVIALITDGLTAQYRQNAALENCSWQKILDDPVQ